MHDPTNKLLRFAQKFQIDEVLEASSTMMAQAAMRRSGTMADALAIYDLVAAAGRKCIQDNWERCQAGETLQ